MLGRARAMAIVLCGSALCGSALCGRQRYGRLISASDFQ
jgi:hypothetical protein